MVSEIHVKRIKVVHAKNVHPNLDGKLHPLSMVSGVHLEDD